MPVIPNLDQEAAEELQIANLYRIKAILEVMKKNLLLINNIPNAQIVMVAGGNLYELALKYYGDATQWNYIAEANNLVDPQIVLPNNEPIQLLIPPLPVTKSGGVYNA